MTPRRLSPSRLVARIETLSRRHRELDRRINSAEQRSLTDTPEIKRLKMERLGLKDAIRLTRSLLSKLTARPASTSWQQQFHSG